MVWLPFLATVMSPVRAPTVDLKVGRGANTGVAREFVWVPLIVPELVRALKNALQPTTAPLKTRMLSATTAYPAGVVTPLLIPSSNEGVRLGATSWLLTTTWPAVICTPFWSLTLFVPRMTVFGTVTPGGGAPSEAPVI